MNQECLNNVTEVTAQPGLTGDTAVFEVVEDMPSFSGEQKAMSEFEYAEISSEGLAPVKLNGKWGYVNRKGVDTFGNK